MGHDTGAEPSAVVAHAHVASPAVRVAAPAVAVAGQEHGVAVAGHAVAGHAVAGHAVVHRGCWGGRDVRAEPGYQLGDGRGVPGALCQCIEFNTLLPCVSNIIVYYCVYHPEPGPVLATSNQDIQSQAL